MRVTREPAILYFGLPWLYCSALDLKAGSMYRSSDVGDVHGAGFERKFRSARPVNDI